MLSLDITGYHWEVTMSDLLIRDVPEAVVAAIDARAAAIGLSRTEFIRRRLAQEAAVGNVTVTTADLHRFGKTFGDLADDSVMDAAWR